MAPAEETQGIKGRRGTRGWFSKSAHAVYRWGIHSISTLLAMWFHHCRHSRLRRHFDWTCYNGALVFYKRTLVAPILAASEIQASYFILNHSVIVSPAWPGPLFGKLLKSNAGVVVNEMLQERPELKCKVRDLQAATKRKAVILPDPPTSSVPAFTEYKSLYQTNPASNKTAKRQKLSHRQPIMNPLPNPSLKSTSQMLPPSFVREMSRPVKQVCLVSFNDRANREGQSSQSWHHAQWHHDVHGIPSNSNLMHHQGVTPGTGQLPWPGLPYTTDCGREVVAVPSDKRCLPQVLCNSKPNVQTSQSERQAGKPANTWNNEDIELEISDDGGQSTEPEHDTHHLSAQRKSNETASCSVSHPQNANGCTTTVTKPMEKLDSTEEVKVLACVRHVDSTEDCMPQKLFQMSWCYAYISCSLLHDCYELSQVFDLVHLVNSVYKFLVAAMPSPGDEFHRAQTLQEARWWRYFHVGSPSSWRLHESHHSRYRMCRAF